MIRFFLSLTLATVLAFPLPARADETQDLRSVTALRLLGSMAGFVAGWCDDRLPNDRARHAKALADWRAGERLDEIDALYTAMAGSGAHELDQAFEGARSALIAKLDADYVDPVAVCDDLPAFLAQNFDLRRALPDDAWRVAKLLDAAPNPGADAEDEVADTLKALGATLPLSPGGPLQAAAFQCVQRRDYGRNVVSTYAYRLSLFPDTGLRLDQVTVENSEGASSPGRDFIGTYAYTPATGEIAATGWDTEHEDLDDFAMFAGEYTSTIEDRVLVNTFRLYTDAAGRLFIYGNEEFADQSTTLCAGLGSPGGQSPVAEDAARRAAAAAERDRFRTAPGRGVPFDRIAGIYYNSELQLDAGGGTSVAESVAVLLTDGWGYRNPGYTPHDLDAAASRAGEPERWFPWRRAGVGIEVLDTTGIWAEGQGFMADPAAPEDLIGSFSFQQAFGVSPATIATFSTTEITFGADGRFSWFTSHQAGAYVSSDSEEGSYALDGYALELRYDDGRVDRPLVFTWGDGNLVIGGQTYSR